MLKKTAVLNLFFAAFFVLFFSSCPTGIPGLSDANQISVQNIWTEFNIPARTTQYYYFDAVAGSRYYINWDDSYDGSSSYTADIFVTLLDSDGKSLAVRSDSGYLLPIVYAAAASGKVYLQIDLFPGSSGTFALKVSDATSELVTVEPAKNTSWTIMMYMDADNNLEAALLGDLQQVKYGLIDGSVNVIVLIDRTAKTGNGYSSDAAVLGSDFSDARLFRLLPHGYMPLEGKSEFPDIHTNSGDELNMGDADTLKKFIEYCKSNYTATNYALVISNHGGGVRAVSDDSSTSALSKGISYDETSSNDPLYTGEITDVLDSRHSVNLLILDACLMGMHEIGYEYRPDNTGKFSADYMVASAPNVWGAGFDYTSVLARIYPGASGTNGQLDKTTGTYEARYSPGNLTPLDLGAMFVEEQRDSVEATTSTDQVLALFDLSKAQAVQTALNAFAVQLDAQSDSSSFQSVVFGTFNDLNVINYFDENISSEWVSWPQIDLYDMANLIETQLDVADTEAQTLKTAVADMVVYSYAGSNYTGFVEGTHGLGIFSPAGNQNFGYASPTFAYQWWYAPWDTVANYGGGEAKFQYGKIDSCAAGASSGNSIVENWFELLDKWYDVTSPAGGYNGYIF